MRASLESIRCNKGGLNRHRQALLDRVPNSGDWAAFPYEHIDMKDLAYLTAKTGHEFAILRGKKEDILFHGTSSCCSFDNELFCRLTNNQLSIYGHSHPGEDPPTPSAQDRATLKEIGQTTSKLISDMTGQEITYAISLFDDITL